MELVCFICQEYQSEIGHQTTSCPKVACKRCGLKGHFGMNCENRGTASEKNDETEVSQESKAVDFSITDEEASVFKPDNFIKLKNLKSLLKMESDNQAMNDGFSPSEEKR